MAARPQAQPAYIFAARLPLKDAPDWLSHIEIYREGDQIIFEIMKTNGLSYAHAKVPDTLFNDFADTVLTVAPQG